MLGAIQVILEALELDRRPLRRSQTNSRPAAQHLAPARLIRDTWGASPREIDVYIAMLTGEKRVVVAESLRIKPRTLEEHLSNLYRKVGVHDFRELEAKIRAALRRDDRAT